MVVNRLVRGARVKSSLETRDARHSRMHRLTHVPFIANSASEREAIALQWRCYAPLVAEYTSYTPIVRNSNSDPPKRTHYCYYDGEPFDGEPVYLPYDVKRMPYVVYVGGPAFCSYACAKRQLMERQSARATALLLEALAHVSRHYKPEPVPYDDAAGALVRSQRWAPIVPAPSKCMLTKYGGSMTIEQFRAAEATITNVRLPPCVAVGQQCVETVDVGRRKTRYSTESCASTRARLADGPALDAAAAPVVQRRRAPGTDSMAPPPTASSLKELNAAAGVAALGYGGARDVRRMMGIARPTASAMPPPPPASVDQLTAAARVRLSTSRPIGGGTAKRKAGATVKTIDETLTSSIKQESSV